jgi:hypothetical protein
VPGTQNSGETTLGAQLDTTQADRTRVMNLALAAPTYDDLVAVLANQRRLLEHLLFKHAEIAMLIAAGEHRFVGRAIDEALEVEAELGATDMVRAMTAIALHPPTGGLEPSLGELLAGAPDNLATHLAKLGDDLGRLMVEIERYRTQASAWAGERAERVRELATRTTPLTYSRDGRPGD